MRVTGGIERVVALGTLSADWRTKVLADPLAAAAQAGIELTDSEQLVFRSVKRATLEHMIDSSNGSAPKPSCLMKLAAGAAAAAVLVTAATGCSGIRPDLPRPETERGTAPQPSPAGPPSVSVETESPPGTSAQR